MSIEDILKNVNETCDEDIMTDKQHVIDTLDALTPEELKILKSNIQGIIGTHRTLKAQWEGYRKEVIKPNAPPTQVTECRLAFYAGVIVMMTMFATISKNSLLATVEMMNFQDELDQFQKDTYTMGVEQPQPSEVH